MKFKPQREKKVLSLVLCVAVMLSVMVMGAGAAFSDQADIENTEAVDMCSALNIIGGYEDGSFHPERNIKRSEITKMICVALNGGREPNVSTNAVPTFSDVRGTSAEWAEGYIESCVAQGIVSGVGGGRFAPDGNVTGSQLAKMLLVSLGYNSDNEGFTGNAWETNVNVRASQKGLYDGLATLDTSAAVTRDQAAQMVWNALNAYEVEYKTTLVTDANGNLVTQTTVQDKLVQGIGGFVKITLLEDKYEAIIAYGYMTDISYDSAKGKYTYTFEDAASFGGDIIDTDAYDNTLTTTQDFSDLYGMKTKVIYKNDADRTVYGIVAEDSEVLLSGVIGDLPDDLVAGDTSMKVNDVTYRFDTNAGDVDIYGYNNADIVNGLADLATPIAVGTLREAWSFELIDNDGDGKANCVVVHPFTVSQVSYVGTDSFNIAANNEMGVAAAAGIKFDSVTAYEGMAKDDYVMIVGANNTLDGDVAYSKVDVVEGKVTSANDDGAEIDGTWYNTLITPLELSDTYKIAVVNGYICAFERVTSGADVSEYAVVTQAKASADNGMFGDQVELLFTDGSKKIVDADQDYSKDQDGWVGELVTFEIEDGEYKLTKADGLTAGDNGTSGFDTIVTTNTDSYKYSSGGKSTINNEYIADDAVIFTYNGSKYDVITGSALKKYADASVANVNNAFGNKVSNGYNNVVLAYVTVAADVDTQTEFYGYVTSSLTTTKNEDNETVSKLSLWTADGQLNDILADANLGTTVAKGSVVTYDVNDDGSYTIKPATVSRAAILAYNESNGTIRFTDSTLMDVAGNNVNYEVSSDTVILGINSDTNTGVEGVSITTAVETATDNLYQANAYYYSTGGTELDVLVIDTYADLPAMPGVLTSDATTQAGLQTALNSNTNVTFNADQLAAAASVTAPAGTTLKITDVDDTNKLTVTAESGATIDISALADDATADKLEVVVKPGATFIYDNGTLVGSTGYLTSTGGITVKNAASNTLDVTLTGTVTLKKDLVIGAGDTIHSAGANIVGDVAGRTIVVRDATKITGQDSTNFYDNTNDTTADNVANGTYVWTLDIDSKTEGNQSGWVKQP